MSIVELAKATASTWHPAPGASESAVAALSQELGFELPSDYLEFLRFSNGGFGDLPVNPWGFDSLWTAEDLVEWNRDYEVPKYCPGFVGFGSSGGGEMFAFDMRAESPWSIVVVPFIGMEPNAAIKVADDLRSFVGLFGRRPEP